MDESQNKILHEERQDPDSFLNSKAKPNNMLFGNIYICKKHTFKQGNDKGNIQANLQREVGEWDKEDTLRQIR